MIRLNMNRGAALAVLVFLAQDVAAVCTPSHADETKRCDSCGNLEQNKRHGVDLTWNATKNSHGPNVNSPMRIALSVRGFSTVNLMNPPYSSPGVLFYRGIVRDPSFTVTNSQTYSQALAISSRIEVVPRPSGYFQLRAEMRELLAQSTTTGTDPYIVSIYDQDGNLITREEMEKGTPELSRASFGNNDLNPDPQYQRTECIDKDPRYNGEGSGDDDGGSGGGGSRAGPPDDGGDSGGPTVRCGNTAVDDGERRRTCRVV